MASLPMAALLGKLRGEPIDSFAFPPAGNNGNVSVQTAAYRPDVRIILTDAVSYRQTFYNSLF